MEPINNVVADLPNDQPMKAAIGRVASGNYINPTVGRFVDFLRSGKTHEEVIELLTADEEDLLPFVAASSMIDADAFAQLAAIAAWAHQHNSSIALDIAQGFVFGVLNLLKSGPPHKIERVADGLQFLSEMPERAALAAATTQTFGDPVPLDESPERGILERFLLDPTDEEIWALAAAPGDAPAAAWVEAATIMAMRCDTGAPLLEVLRWAYRQDERFLVEMVVLGIRSACVRSLKLGDPEILTQMATLLRIVAADKELYHPFSTTPNVLSRWDADA